MYCFVCWHVYCCTDVCTGLCTGVLVLCDGLCTDVMWCVGRCTDEGRPPTQICQPTPHTCIVQFILQIRLDCGPPQLVSPFAIMVCILARQQLIHQLLLWMHWHQPCTQPGPQILAFPLQTKHLLLKFCVADNASSWCVWCMNNGCTTHSFSLLWKGKLCVREFKTHK